MKRALTGAAIFTMLLLPSVAAKSADDHDSSIAEKWVAGWNSHDADKLVSAFTSDVVYEDVAFGEVSHGAAELRKFAASEFAAVPDLSIKLLHSYVHDGHGMIEWSFSGTDKDIFKTGKKFSVRGASVIDVRGGKISRSLDFYDAATIMRQVGALPAQPSQPSTQK